MGQPDKPTRPESGPREQAPPATDSSTPPNGDSLVLAQKLAAARGGSRTAMGELFDACRNYLLLIANSAVGKGLQARVAASDLVQETFLEAGQKFERFTGNSEEALLRWLAYILENKLGNTFKGQLWSAKRDPGREVRMGDVDNAEYFEGLFADPCPSPSGVVSAAEEGQKVRAAILQLPEDYQRVLELRVYERLTFDEVGRAMNRTNESARKLFIRAMDDLRVRLKTHDPSAN